MQSDIPKELCEFLGAYEFLNSRSLIHLAAVCNDGRLKDVLEELCRQSPSALDELDDTRMTPLMLASCWGRDASVQVLLQHGANLEIRGERGKTALILAAEEGQDTVISLLVKAGANLNAVDDQGLDAFQYALREEHYRCAQVILNAKTRAARSSRTVASAGGNVRPFVALNEPATGGQAAFRYCQIAATPPLSQRTAAKSSAHPLKPKQSMLALF